MNAEIKWVDGLTLLGKADSGHWITMDASESLGGSDAAARPMELFLLALGGCTGMDVLSILTKKRVQLDDFKIQLQAQRADEHPKVFKEIIIKFLFYGKDISRQAVERSIELSETKYCSASAMLRAGADIKVEYEIIEK
ncbi:OsmC family protein [candidate division KSB1 bacterium]|nr:OsmC family protein [candidate division KSB1 bacterium]